MTTPDTDDRSGAMVAAPVPAEPTYRQLDHWARRGWLRPYGQGGGSGNPREWPLLERRIASLMKRLIDAGFAPASAAQIARTSLQSGEPAALGPGLTLIITTGQDDA